MSGTEIILLLGGLVVGIAIGFVIGWRVFAGKAHKLNEAEKQIVQLQTTLENERSQFKEKLEFLDEAKNNLRTEFENLAHKIFEARAQKFGEETKKVTEKNKEDLGNLLNPLREDLAGFKKKVEDVHEKELKQHADLSKELNTLRDLNERLSEDAVDLTKALKGESKTRGTWGELVLERVLEQSGLEEGREYETQVHLKDKHGGVESRYPDVVVHLPNNRDVVIDAKVALVAYEASCSCDEDDERAQHLKQHVAAVRTHMEGLAAKNYQDLEGINAMDLVLMCVPNEPALIAAMANDSNLYKDAFNKRVMIVGPNTLLLALRIVDVMWHNEDQNRNAQDIADRGAKLHDKFVGFVNDLQEIGSRLEQARDAYDSAYSKLSEGRGNLVGQAQKLADLGVQTKKQLPGDLIEKAAEEESDAQ